MALVEREARALGYTAPSAAEQQKRALKAIAPLEKLSVSKGVFGGYWATQCTKEDRNVQDTFRTILKPNEAPRLETRYQQARHGDCGDATNGIYPMVLRGLPVANAPRPDLDVSGLEITRCESGVKRVYKVDGRTTSCLDGRGSDCRDVVAGFVREAGGC